MKATVFFLLLMIPSFAFSIDLIDEQLMDIVNESNKSMPMNVGNGMTALNMGYIPGARVIIINYQLQNATVEQIKQYGIDNLKAQGKQNLVRLNCTSTPNSEFIREEGVRMKYSYYDKDYNHVYDIWVSKDDCLGL